MEGDICVMSLPIWINISVRCRLISLRQPILPRRHHWLARGRKHPARNRIYHTANLGNSFALCCRFWPCKNGWKRDGEMELIKSKSEHTPDKKWTHLLTTFSRISLKPLYIKERMVLVESRSALLPCTISNWTTAILPVYVKHLCCQHAQMFLSLFHSD